MSSETSIIETITFPLVYEVDLRVDVAICCFAIPSGLVSRVLVGYESCNAYNSKNRICLKFPAGSNTLLVLVFM